LIFGGFYRLSNSFQTKTPVLPQITVSVQKPGQEPGNSLIFWNTLRVDGVQTNQLATIQSMSGTFHSGQHRHWFHYNASSWQTSSYLDQYYSQALLKARQEFPTDTLWINSINLPTVFNQQNLPLAQEVNSSPSPWGATGQLDGNLQMDILQFSKVADLPVTPTTAWLSPGIYFKIQNFNLLSTELTIRARQTGPRSLFDDAPKYPLIYILHHPRLGEAFIARTVPNYCPSEPIFVAHIPAQLTLYFQNVPARIRMSGLSMQEWLKEARLIIFCAEFKGHAYGKFSQTNFTLTFHSTATPNVDAMTWIRNAVLPSDPTPVQIREYIHVLAVNTPRNWPAEDKKLIESKLAQMGSQGVPMLLEELPLNDPFDQNFAWPFLRTNLTREHLPQLRQALERDTALATLAREKQWNADVRDVVLKILPDHRKPFAADTLIIAAEARDPATYDELAWRFIHLNGGHARVEPFLKECPGFNLAETIRQTQRCTQVQIVSY
jgi:hypothetical protein